MKKVLFHIPYNLSLPISSGSYNRPRKLREAFKSLGISIFEISGTYKERKALIKRAKEGIKINEFSFVYSESATIPTALSNEYHVPLNADIKFLKFCKEEGLKIGLFYRDIHWKYLNAVSLKSKLIGFYYKPFYVLDLKVYAKIIDVLFLPTKAMQKYIPFLSHLKSINLPAGGSVYENIKNENKTNSEVLELIYVGGIGFKKSLYDSTVLFRALNMSDIKLTVICRKNEWQEVQSDYSYDNNKNISILHLLNEFVNSRLLNADVGLLIYSQHQYRDFAFPYKVFEYIFNDLPIIANEGTPVADFIRENKIGWIVPNVKEDIEFLLDKLNKNRHLISECKKNIIQLKSNNTWEARVKTIIKYLS